jgi:hypothetical protein
MLANPETDPLINANYGFDGICRGKTQAARAAFAVSFYPWEMRPASRHSAHEQCFARMSSPSPGVLSVKSSAKWVQYQQEN